MADLDIAWQNLEREAARLKPVHLRELFASGAVRFGAFSQETDGLLIDFSKEKLDPVALDALLDLARTAGIEEKRDALFAGKRVNVTEDRPALHMALRDGAGASVMVDEQDIVPVVQTERARMLGFAEDVRTGRIAAADGVQFGDVLCLGIGGSDLGPCMAAAALIPWASGPKVHFVSNVDGAHLGDCLKALDPARTLVIVASKSFSTLETMTNARAARDWLGGRASAQMAAISSNPDAVSTFGIDPARTFAMWDWVGGRYSVWSSVGLPLAIAIGPKAFTDFLAGAASMDRHFQEAPFEQNLPILLALIGIWRRNAMGWPSAAVIPYDQRLARFPDFLQQLDMESNGKRVTLDGAPVARETGPLIFGGAGTNTQHSFFQLLHQGTDAIPVDFLLGAGPVEADAEQHRLLAANALAQASALAFGSTDSTSPHKHFPGDRPSTTILYDRLDPPMLGRLIALFEHKIFVQGAIWGINSFDQFGVELGKRLTEDVLPMLHGEGAKMDGSTEGLAGWIREANGLRSR